MQGRERVSVISHRSVTNSDYINKLKKASFWQSDFLGRLDFCSSPIQLSPSLEIWRTPWGFLGAFISYRPSFCSNEKDTWCNFVKVIFFIWSI